MGTSATAARASRARPHQMAGMVEGMGMCAAARWLLGAGYVSGVSWRLTVAWAYPQLAKPNHKGAEATCLSLVCQRVAYT